MTTIEKKSKMKQFFDPIPLLFYIMSHETADIIACIPTKLQKYILSKKNTNVTEKSGIELLISSANHNFLIAYPSQIIQKISQWLLDTGISELKLATTNGNAIKSIMLVSFIEIDVPDISETRRNKILKIMNTKNTKVCKKEYSYEYNCILPDKSYVSFLVNKTDSTWTKIITGFPEMKILFTENILVLKFNELETGIDMLIMIEEKIAQIARIKQKNTQTIPLVNENEDDITMKKKPRSKVLKNNKKPSRVKSSTIHLTKSENILE